MTFTNQTIAGKISRYSNAVSGLTSTNLQDAVDELAARSSGGVSLWSAEWNTTGGTAPVDPATIVPTTQTLLYGTTGNLSFPNGGGKLYLDQAGFTARLTTQLLNKSSSTVTIQISVTVDDAAWIALNGSAIGTLAVGGTQPATFSLPLVPGWNTLAIGWVNNADYVAYLTVAGVGGDLLSLVDGMRAGLPVASGGGGAGSAGYEIFGSNNNYALATAYAPVQIGASNMQLVLPAGSYEVKYRVAILAGATANDSYYCKLVNTTDSVDIPYSESFTDNLAAGEQSEVVMSRIFTLTATKTICLYAQNATAARGNLVGQECHITAVSISPATVTSTTPNAPTISATAGTTQIVIGRTGGGGDAWDLYRGTTSGGEVLVQSGLTGSSYTDTGLTNGTTYYYKAKDLIASTGVLSAFSNEVSGIPAATYPAYENTFIVSTYGSSLSVNVSTAGSNRLLVAYFGAWRPSGSVFVTGGGLTWTQLATTGAYPWISSVWWAIAPTALSSASITGSASSGIQGGNLWIDVFNNVNTSTPFDQSSIIAGGFGANPSESITPTVSNTRVIAHFSSWDNNLSTAGSGYTASGSCTTNTQWGNDLSEYANSVTAGSGSPVSAGFVVAAGASNLDSLFIANIV